MRTTQRRIDPSLIEQTQRAPECFEFFQLVRLYEIVYRRRANSPGGDPISERIRFRNTLRLGFAPSQVDGMDVVNGNYDNADDVNTTGRVEIVPSFIGLLGVNGTLPIHYTEQVIAHERYKRDTAGRAFLDLFTNRAVGHFYRGWKKYKLPALYETDRQSRFLPLVLSLCGLGFQPLRQRLNDAPGVIDDESIAYFSGLFRQRPVSANGLERILGGYFRDNVRIEQFVGRWYLVPVEQRTMLGGRNADLGVNSLAGERVWQRNLRIGIHIGPLDHARYMAFLPEGELAAALAKLLTLATGAQFEYEIRPILRAADVRPVGLDALNGARLGYDAFMLTRPELRDRSDTRYVSR